LGTSDLVYFHWLTMISQCKFEYCPQSISTFFRYSHQKFFLNYLNRNYNIRNCCLVVKIFLKKFLNYFLLSGACFANRPEINKHLQTNRDKRFELKITNFFYNKELHILTTNTWARSYTKPEGHFSGIFRNVNRR
jgi:hypothetical protein